MKELKKDYSLPEFFHEIEDKINLKVQIYNILYEIGLWCVKTKTNKQTKQVVFWLCAVISIVQTSVLKLK